MSESAIHTEAGTGADADSGTDATTIGQAQIEALLTIRSHCAEKIRQNQAELAKHQEQDKQAARLLQLLTSPTNTRPLESRSETCELVKDILQTADDSQMHYRAIYDRVTERGYEILGKDPANSLLNRICADPRFKRVAAGTYRLSESASPGASVATAG